MKQKYTDKIRELDLLLDHHFIYDKDRNVYFIHHAHYHKHLVPRLQAMLVPQVEEKSGAK